MELHISECADCRREAEKLREMINLIGGAERPDIPSLLWEKTQRKLQTSLEAPARGRLLGVPKWGLIPAGAVVFTFLFLLLASQLFFHGRESDLMPMTVYLQEHALSYSEQALAPDLLSELTITQTNGITEETQHDESISELEMLMEVHYGFYTTNGS